MHFCSIFQDLHSLNLTHFVTFLEGHIVVPSQSIVNPLTPVNLLPLQMSPLPQNISLNNRYSPFFYLQY